MQITLEFNISAGSLREMATSLKTVGKYIQNTKLCSEGKKRKLRYAADYSADLLREIARGLN